MLYDEISIRNRDLSIGIKLAEISMLASVSLSFSIGLPSTKFIISKNNESWFHSTLLISTSIADKCPEMPTVNVCAKSAAPIPEIMPGELGATNS